MTPLPVFWFRCDLWLEDNTELFQALACGRPVLPIFIFNLFILDSLPHDDARVTFTYDIL
ncbi:deoxyribodipyrimidine photo-lyase [Nitrosomonas communis]|uniref:deoxyribodipyrimidine photo-lyase n=1 Tax=Nitrosomonas communis TaxID=44574 RepID=UPI0026F07CC9|nr:deoxyribodipyrimidine photo-lyase [Nitrosomonas communis]MCO6428792.1 deoxyribodipyrimidine photo-lyase [Nitrosomonas communis]